MQMRYSVHIKKNIYCFNIFLFILCATLTRIFRETFDVTSVNCYVLYTTWTELKLARYQSIEIINIISVCT